MSKVSILIINYNGEKWLKSCINSVLSQSYKHIEIIVVDNASKDKSVHIITELYSSIKLLRNGNNLGFAGGANSGIKYVSGEFVLLLNTDATLEKDFIKKMLMAFEEIDSLAIVQSKIVYMDRKDTIDTCGSFWTDTTFLYHYGNSKDQSLKKI